MALAAGDVTVYKDGVLSGNITTLPVEISTSGLLTLTLSASEMTADRVAVRFRDAAGAQWQDAVLTIHTVAVNFDDIPTAAAIATAVWASGTRTLTSFGTLIADIWANVTRTLTQTAAQVAASVTGSDLTIVRGVTFTATLTGLTIPATWSKVYFTAKQYHAVADTEAVVQIVVSNPAAPLTDGLLRINRAAGTLANGSLVVNQGAGTVAITLADDASTLLVSGAYAYDVKALLSDGTSVVLTAANVTVADTVTESIT